MVIETSKQGLNQEDFNNYLTNPEIYKRFLSNKKYSKKFQRNHVNNKRINFFLTDMDPNKEDDDKKEDSIKEDDDHKSRDLLPHTLIIDDSRNRRTNNSGPSRHSSGHNQNTRRTVKEHEVHIEEVVHKYNLLQLGSRSSNLDNRAPNDRNVRCDARVEINVSPDPLIRQVFNDEFQNLEPTPPVSKKFKSKRGSNSKVKFDEQTIQPSKPTNDAIAPISSASSPAPRYANAETQTDITRISNNQNEILINAAISDKATVETNTSNFSILSNNDESFDEDVDGKNNISSQSLSSIESLIRVRRLQGGAEVAPQIFGNHSSTFTMHPQHAVNLIKGACSEEDLVLIISPYGSDRYETSSTVEIHAFNKTLEHHCGSFCMPKKELPILDESGVLKRYDTILITKKLDEDNSIKIITKHIVNYRNSSMEKTKGSFHKVFKHLKRLRLGRFSQSKYYDDIFKIIDDLEFEIYAFPEYNKKGNQYTLEILSHNKIYLGSLQVRVDEIVKQLEQHPNMISRFNVVLDINKVNLNNQNTSVLANIAENLGVLRFRDNVTRVL